MTEPIRFYRSRGPYGFLSNLYPAPIIFDEMLFACSEYAYQFAKPRKPEIAEWLSHAPTPSLCAQAAHALFGWQVRPDWADIKVDRMRRVLRAKFTQHPGLQEGLLATGDMLLVEDSTIDAFWGIGRKGTGRNMLGVLLMEIRAELGEP